ncbi:MAG: hypothetical protein KC457_13965 [Myxococcales bacterium]|nr:hypothetical protein [Myxococcales bacterium]
MRFGELEGPLIFDFGTAASQLYTSAYRVTPLKYYTTSLGYGWIDTPTVYATNRSTGNAINRDFNYSRDATFRVDLPNGVYDIEVRTGDIEAHARSSIVVVGFVVSNRDLHPAGEWHTHHHTVRIEDGNLDLQIFDGTAGPTDPGDAIINGLTIIPHALPQDPVAWEMLASGVEYRRATEAERIANDWPLDTYLVYAPTGVFTTTSAQVQVPIDDEEVLDLTLDLVGSDPALTIVELGYGVPSSGGSQSLVRYQTSTGTTGTQGVLLEDALRGGFSATIQPAPGSAAHLIGNGEASWQLSPIPLAGGSVPDGTVLYRSSALGSGPSSVLAPFPTDAYGFALIGEIKWCMAHEVGWAADLAMRGLWVHDGFAACPEGQCQNHHGVELITRALYCNVTSDEAAALACDMGGNCPPNQYAHDYSYLGCDGMAGCYANNIVANLQQAADEGHDVPDLHLAQVVHLKKVKVQPIPPEDGPFDAYWTVCGAAAFPDLADCNGTISFTTDGVSVAGADYTCSDFSVSTHEFGHNFGALHDAANPNYPDNGCLGTVMDQGEGKCNQFSLDNSLTIESCNLDDQTQLVYANNSWCPDVAQVETMDCPRSGDLLLYPPP